MIRSRLLALVAKATLMLFTLQANLASAVLVGPYLDLPSVPYYVGQSVAPNILLTLDDSGSMMWAYVPDSFGDLDSHWTDGTAANGSKIIAFKSGLNALYYNPAVVYTAPEDANGTPYPTSFTAAWLNGYAQGQGSMNLATGYLPTQYYESSQQNSYGFGSYVRTSHCAPIEQSGANCPGVGVGPNTGTRAYYWTYNVSLLCPNTVPDGVFQPLPSCFTFHSIAAADEQNFANWFSFYRTRNLAVVSAAIAAFATLPSDYRVGWQALNSCTGGTNTFSNSCRGWDSTRANVDARIGSFNAAKKAAMWQWLTRLPSYNGTPLREAFDRGGQYLQTTGNMSPYADTLGSSSTTYASCRQSYAVVMTDGSWNSDGPAATITNKDNSSFTLPDGQSYSPRVPFRDTNTANLADIAFTYWATDLQPSLSQTVKKYTPYAVDPSNLTNAEYWDPRNDPAAWQHMTSFFVSLGMSRNLTNPTWQGSTFAGSATIPYSGYYSVLNGGVPWPVTGDDLPGNVHDMWHAAIDSRGAFFSVESPDALVDAFRQIRNRISDQQGAATAVAQTSLQTQSDSMAFAASYNTNKWDGTLRAFKVNADGTTAATPTWTTDTTFNYLGAANFAGNNKVFTKGSSGGLVAFNATNLVNLPAASKSALDADAVSLGVSTTALVNWILGDDSKGTLRSRNLLMGDILASQPVFEGGRDYGYVETMWPSNSDGTRIDGTVYATYVKAKSPGGTKYKPTVYFGANDGMLHAFSGDTGARRFSYIPSVLIPKLGDRADPDYVHEYFVDGPITLSDVHNGTEWRTILVGTLGGGGKGAYALDVTDPDSPTLLWEFFPTDGDLGYVMGEPVIARAANGTWVVAFGNGYGSDNNSSYLYIVNALTGAQLSKIKAASTGATTPTSAAGLSSPALLYLAGRQLGYAYAGDWQGNLWRFDIGDPAPANWKLGFAGIPLFQARTPSGAIQKISAKPRVVSDRILGRVIVFGTGKLIELTDKDDLSVQSVYGIYDRASGSSATRADLTQQTILSQTATVRNVSTNTLSKPAGWYLDLNPSGSTLGERVIAPVNYVPELSVFLATTVQPAGGACDSSLSSAVMALSPFSGAGNSLFNVATGSTSNGVIISGVVASPSVVRKTGTLTVMINRGVAGIDKLTVAKGWNPRAAWRQLR